MSICPENTDSAGPVMRSCAPSQATEHAAARLDAHRRIEQAAADAGGHRRAGARATGQRSPAPRSWTRRRMLLRSTTCMKPALTRRGKRACVSTSGPITPTGRRPHRRPPAPRAGWKWPPPILRPSAAGRRGHRVPAPTACPALLARSQAGGVEGQGGRLEAGAAHVHGDRSSSPSSSTRMPVEISARSGFLSDRPCSCTKRTKQRAPLPQCSTSLPSALKMR